MKEWTRKHKDLIVKAIKQSSEIDKYFSSPSTSVINECAENCKEVVSKCNEDVAKIPQLLSVNQQYLRTAQLASNNQDASINSLVDNNNKEFVKQRKDALVCIFSARLSVPFEQFVVDEYSLLNLFLSFIVSNYTNEGCLSKYNLETNCWKEIIIDLENWVEQLCYINLISSATKKDQINEIKRYAEVIKSNIKIQSQTNKKVIVANGLYDRGYTGWSIARQWDENKLFVDKAGYPAVAVVQQHANKPSNTRTWLQFDPLSHYHPTSNNVTTNLQMSPLQINSVSEESVTDNDFLELMISLKAVDSLNPSGNFVEYLYKCLLARLDGETADVSIPTVIPMDNKVFSSSWRVIQALFRYLLEAQLSNSNVIVQDYCDSIMLDFKLFLFNTFFEVLRDAPLPLKNDESFILHLMTKEVAANLASLVTLHEKSQLQQHIDLVEAAQDLLAKSQHVQLERKLKNTCTNLQVQQVTNTQMKFPLPSSLKTVSNGVAIPQFIANSITESVLNSSFITPSLFTGDLFFHSPSKTMIDTLSGFSQQIQELAKKNSSFSSVIMLIFEIEQFVIGLHLLKFADKLQKELENNTKQLHNLAKQLLAVGELYYECYLRKIAATTNVDDCCEYDPQYYARCICVQFTLAVSLDIINRNDPVVGPLLKDYAVCMSVHNNASKDEFRTLKFENIWTSVISRNSNWLVVLEQLNQYWHQSGNNQTPLFKHELTGNQYRFSISSNANTKDDNIMFAYELLKKSGNAPKFDNDTANLAANQHAIKWIKLWTGNYLPETFKSLQKQVYNCHASMFGFTEQRLLGIQQFYSNPKNKQIGLGIRVRVAPVIYTNHTAVVQISLPLASRIDYDNQGLHFNRPVFFGGYVVDKKYKSSFQQIVYPHPYTNKFRLTENEIICWSGKCSDYDGKEEFLNRGFIRSNPNIKIQRLFIALKKGHLYLEQTEHALLALQALFETGELSTFSRQFDTARITEEYVAILSSKAMSLGTKLTQYKALRIILYLLNGFITFCKEVSLREKILAALAKIRFKIVSYDVLNVPASVLEAYLILSYARVATTQRNDAMEIIKARYQIEKNARLGNRLSNTLYCEVMELMLQKQVELQRHCVGTNLLSECFEELLIDSDCDIATDCWKFNEETKLLTLKNFEFDLIQGSLYKNKSPISGLAERICINSDYKAAFGNNRFVFSTSVFSYNSHQLTQFDIASEVANSIKITLLDKKAAKLWIQVKKQSDPPTAYQTFVPQAVIKQCLPTFLLQDFTHWQWQHFLFFKCNNEVIYTADLNLGVITNNNGNVVLSIYKNGDNWNKELKNILCYNSSNFGFEDINFVTVLSDNKAASAISQVELPRFNLTFAFSNNVLSCNEVKGYCVAANQKLSTLLHINQYIILDNIEGIGREVPCAQKIIVANKPFEIEKLSGPTNALLFTSKLWQYTNYKNSIKLAGHLYKPYFIAEKKTVDVSSPKYFVYDIDKRLGKLIADDTSGRLYMALLYFETASYDIDPFTGMNSYDTVAESLASCWQSYPFNEAELTVLLRFLDLNFPFYNNWKQEAARHNLHISTKSWAHRIHAVFSYRRDQSIEALAIILRVLLLMVESIKYKFLHTQEWQQKQIELIEAELNFFMRLYFPIYVTHYFQRREYVLQRCRLTVEQEGLLLRYYQQIESRGWYKFNNLMDTYMYYVENQSNYKFNYTTKQARKNNYKDVHLLFSKSGLEGNYGFAGKKAMLTKQKALSYEQSFLNFLENKYTGRSFSCKFFTNDINETALWSQAINQAINSYAGQVDCSLFIDLYDKIKVWKATRSTTLILLIASRNFAFSTFDNLDDSQIFLQMLMLVAVSTKSFAEILPPACCRNNSARFGFASSDRKPSKSDLAYIIADKAQLESAWTKLRQVSDNGFITLPLHDITTTNMRSLLGLQLDESKMSTLCTKIKTIVQNQLLYDFFKQVAGACDRIVKEEASTLPSFQDIKPIQHFNTTLTIDDINKLNAKHGYNFTTNTNNINSKVESNTHEQQFVQRLQEFFEVESVDFPPKLPFPIVPSSDSTAAKILSKGFGKELLLDLQNSYNHCYCIQLPRNSSSYFKLTLGSSSSTAVPQLIQDQDSCLEHKSLLKAVKAYRKLLQIVIKKGFKITSLEEDEIDEIEAGLGDDLEEQVEDTRNKLKRTIKKYLKSWDAVAKKATSPFVITFLMSSSSTATNFLVPLCKTETAVTSLSAEATSQDTAVYILDSTLQVLPLSIISQQLVESKSHKLSIMKEFKQFCISPRTNVSYLKEPVVKYKFCPGKEMEQVLQHLTKELKQLSVTCEQLKDACSKILHIQCNLNCSNKEYQYKLWQLSGALPKANMSDILQIILNPRSVTQFQPNIDDTATTGLFDTVKEYVAKELLVLRINRLLPLMSRYFASNINQKQVLLQNIASQALVTSAYPFNSAKYNSWMLFEFENDILIRNRQAELINKMCDDTQNSIFQLNMGEGKTSVISILVSQILANGTQAVRLNVLEPLLGVMTKLLFKKFGGLLYKRVYLLPFARSTEVSTTTLSLLRDMLTTCKDKKHLILLTPQHRMSFQLKFQEILLEHLEFENACDKFSWDSYRNGITETLGSDSHIETRCANVKSILVKLQYIDKDDKLKKVPAGGWQGKQTFLTEIYSAWRKEFKKMTSAYLGASHIHTILRRSSITLKQEVKQKLELFLEIKKIACFDLLDESDEILKFGKELNYTLGEANIFFEANTRYEVTQEILKVVFGDELAMLIASDAAKTFVIYDKLWKPITQVSGVPFIRFYNQNFYNTHIKAQVAKILFTNYVATEFNRNFQNATNTNQLIVATIPESSYLKFVLGELATSASGTTITMTVEQQIINSLHSSKQVQLLYTLLLIKAWLSHGILYHVLSQRYRVTFGLDIGKDKKELAIPFSAKDVPCTKSDFSHPDVLLGLTYVSYYYQGLQPYQLKRVLLSLQEQQLYVKDRNLLAECVRDCRSWIIEYLTQQQIISKPEQPLPQYLQHFKYLDVENKHYFDIIFNCLSRSVTLINRYLLSVVFPAEALHHGKKLTANAYSLAAVGDTKGFSGTDDVKLLFPSTVVSKRLNSQKGINGKMIHILSRPKNRTYCGKSFDSARDFLRQLCEYAADTPNLCIIVDSGAIVTEMANSSVAEYLLTNDTIPLPSKFLGVIYFDDYDNQLMVYLRKTKTSVCLENCHLAKSQLFAYLDDAHTRGTDLKLPIEAKGVITLCKDMPKDRLMQAVMRLRQLNDEQSVVLWGSPEVTQQILNVCGITNAADITSAEILIWVTCNTVNQVNASLYFVAREQMRSLLKIRAMQYLGYNTDQPIPFVANFISDSISDSIVTMYSNTPTLKSSDTALKELPAVMYKTFWSQFEQEWESKYPDKKIRLTQLGTACNFNNKSAQFLEDREQDNRELRKIAFTIEKYITPKIPISSGLDGSAEKEKSVEEVQIEEKPVPEVRQVIDDASWNFSTVFQPDFVDESIVDDRQSIATSINSEFPTLFPLNKCFSEVDSSRYPHLMNVKWHKDVFATGNFIKTVACNRNKNQYSNNFLRPVDFVLIHYDSAKFTYILISGYEANNLFPLLLQKEKTGERSNVCMLQLADAWKLNTTTERFDGMLTIPNTAVLPRIDEFKLIVVVLQLFNGGSHYNANNAAILKSLFGHISVGSLKAVAPDKYIGYAAKLSIENLDSGFITSTLATALVNSTLSKLFATQESRQYNVFTSALKNFIQNSIIPNSIIATTVKDAAHFVTLVDSAVKIRTIFGYIVELRDSKKEYQFSELKKKFLEPKQKGTNSTIEQQLQYTVEFYSLSCNFMPVSGNSFFESICHQCTEASRVSFKGVTSPTILRLQSINYISQHKEMFTDLQLQEFEQSKGKFSNAANWFSSENIMVDACAYFLNIAIVIISPSSSSDVTCHRLINAAGKNGVVYIGYIACLEYCSLVGTPANRLCSYLRNHQVAAIDNTIVINPTLDFSTTTLTSVPTPSIEMADWKINTDTDQTIIVTFLALIDDTIKAARFNHLLSWIEHSVEGADAVLDSDANRLTISYTQANKEEIQESLISFGVISSFF